MGRLALTGAAVGATLGYALPAAAAATGAGSATAAGAGAATTTAEIVAVQGTVGVIVGSSAGLASNGVVQGVQEVATGRPIDKSELLGSGLSGGTSGLVSPLAGQLPLVAATAAEQEVLVNLVAATTQAPVDFVVGEVVSWSYDD